LLADKRRNAILLGPASDGGTTGELVRAARWRPVALFVLDADVFRRLRGRAGELAAAIAGPTLLTPHEGEFARLFGLPATKLARAAAAAGRDAATVLSRARIRWSPRRRLGDDQRQRRPSWRPPAAAMSSPASRSACSPRA